MCFTSTKVTQIVESFSEMFRSGCDVSIRLTANFMFSFNGIFVNTCHIKRKLKFIN